MKYLVPLVAVAALLPVLCNANPDPATQRPMLTAPHVARLSYVSHQGYSAAIDDVALVPRWVMYSLKGEVVAGCVKRHDNFHAEAQLMAARHAAPDDYAGSGYDKGHMAPADDFTLDAGEMSDSFSMANMAPQLPGLNRAQWEHLEETVRAWAMARGELTIYVGPVLPPRPATIGADRVAVPSAFWKVIVDPTQQQALAFIMPQQAIAKGDLRPWEATVADVQQAAGIELPLPATINRMTKPALWPASITGYRREHKLNCGG
ncbi:MAG TPA: DNA/RNA non-specific endonuclease [Terriglobales bacterium]|nr:DNA/RNA non-specific endonuclease [Terriglobales bacterium]